MELTQLGAVGELVGGVAVLVTLIYLAVQVRHARDQVNEQSVSTALETMQEAFDPVYEGTHASVFRRGLEGEALADADETFIFGLLMTRIATGAMSCARTDDPVCRDYLDTVQERVFSQPGAQRWLDTLPPASPLRRAVTGDH